MGNIDVADGFTCTNPTVILTLDNVLLFQGRFLYSGSVSSGKPVLGTIPAFMAPAHFTTVPIVVNGSVSGGYAYIGRIGIETSGEIKYFGSLDNSILYLEGICINISSKYYNTGLKNTNQAITFPY